MIKKQCLGCRTFFQENQSLPLERMIVQYKNFSIPIQQAKQKWSILKAITSFLNSKGGTIYIGVQDKDCKVVGKTLQSKSKDQFKLFLKHLMERVTPQIDLINREQVSVQFVPVVKNKIFSGKYVVKINIMQGDPSQTYCFVQKIQMIKEGEKKQSQSQNEIQIVYGYVRHNMAGTVQLKGLKLVQQSIRKAKNPIQKITTFHQQCNPQPAELQIQIKKIGFKGINNSATKSRLQGIFKYQLDKMKVSYLFTHDIQNQAMLIQFEKIQDFSKTNQFIRQNLSILNENQEEVRFVDEGNYLDFYLYQNKLITKNSKNNSKQTLQSPNKKDKKKEQPQKRRQEREEEKIVQKLQTKEIQSKKYSFSFTHINPKKKEELNNYLRLSISKKINVNTVIYQNTIQVFFQSKQDLEKYSSICQNKNHQIALSGLGFNNQIRYGINSGNLHILNYDKNKLKDLKKFLIELMGKDLKDLQILKNGNRYILQCCMSQKKLACEWLDKLLINKQFKQFRIPGDIGSVPKIKVFIQCKNQISENK